MVNYGRDLGCHWEGRKRGRWRRDGGWKREARKSQKATAFWKRWETFCVGGTDAKGPRGLAGGGLQVHRTESLPLPQDAKELMEVEDKGGGGGGGGH